MTWLVVLPSPSPVALPTSSSDLWWDGYHTGMWIAFLIAAAIFGAFLLGLAVGAGRFRGPTKLGAPWTSMLGHRNT